MILAALVTALPVILFLAGVRVSHDDMWVFLMFWYLVVMTLWAMSCFTLAKAKGYDTNSIGGMFLFLMLLGFCIPLAPLIFPLGIMFGLKDKTRMHRPRRR